MLCKDVEGSDQENLMCNQMDHPTEALLFFIRDLFLDLEKENLFRLTQLLQISL